jgi:hypothetical protein
MKLPRAVMVAWRDAHGISDGWGKFEAKKDHKPKLVVSIGWVLKDNKVGVSLAQSLDSDKHDDNTIFIPRCNIESVEDL